MKRVNLYKRTCPLCGKTREHIHKQTLQNVSAFLVNLLKVGIVLLAFILMAGALIK